MSVLFSSANEREIRYCIRCEAELIGRINALEHLSEKHNVRASPQSLAKYLIRR